MSFFCTRLIPPLATALIVAIISGCEKTPQVIEISGLTMGTVYSVKLHDSSAQLDRLKLKKGIDAVLQEINRQMSTYDPESVISGFNQDHVTGWHTIPEELTTVIKAALEISDMSDGAFDITIGPLVNLWGFGPVPQEQIPPEPGELDKALSNTGYRLLSLDAPRNRLKKTNPEIAIDLSAIAKGYAVDTIADYLQKQGIGNYLVEIGGEIRVYGMNPSGKHWQIGIEKPVHNDRRIQRVLSLRNQGMATSGDYRNYREIGDVRYSHTIDPRTGNPVTHTLASVTVVHASTMMADGLATALLVSGPKEGLKIALKNDLTVLFVIQSEKGFEERMTKSFHQLLQQ